MGTDKDWRRTFYLQVDRVRIRGYTAGVYGMNYYLPSLWEPIPASWSQKMPHVLRVLQEKLEPEFVFY